MARYTIAHQCGHSEDRQLSGPYKDRERKREWLSEQPCTTCRMAEKQEKIHHENKVNQLLAIAQNLPNLQGTEKQITWAITIRQTMLNYFEGKDFNKKMQYIEKYYPNTLLSFENKIKELIDSIFIERSAKWFIENREDYIEESFDNWLDEIKIENQKVPQPQQAIEELANPKDSIPRDSINSEELSQIKKQIKELEEQQIIHDRWIISIEQKYGDLEDVPSFEWQQMPKNPFEQLSSLKEIIATYNR